MANNLTLRDLRTALASPSEIKRRAFSLAKALSLYISDPQTGKTGHELLLIALENREAFGGSAEVVDALVRQVGLFPYLDVERLGLAEKLAYEFHKPLNMDADNVVFHRVQAEVYNRLMGGENVVLSAPTSFGKSLIIDAVIASRLYDQIAIVVPTIALIDETRRRLSKFSDRFKILTHGSQKRGKRNLFVMTQERLLDYEEIEPLEFFVIDEFYKLKPRPEDKDRSYLLNEAFYRLRKTGAQFYLLGPNIKGIDATLAQEDGLYFMVTDFKTVASEVVRQRPEKGREIDALVELCTQLKEPTLIYCSSPASVRRICRALMSAKAPRRNSVLSIPDSVALESAVSWIGHEYSPEWLFPRALARGIGMHHGKLPRALAQFAVRSFNDGLLNVLVCTSTLIEGVNTKAKNVVIFDNKVARRKIDYFTYNNIAGRSGRMFQHFTGRVFLFHEPPADELPFVEVPILSQPDDTPDSLLVQMDTEDLAQASIERLAQLADNAPLEIEVIRRNRGIDPAAQIRLAEELARQPRHYWSALNWTSRPTSDQLYALSTLIWNYLLTDRSFRAGVGSGRQLAFTVDRFRALRSFTALIKAELADSHGNEDDAVDDAMEWLRHWANYAFPRYLMALDRIQRSVFRRFQLPSGDFSFFASEIENWFLPPSIMALDEYGVPLQLASRLAPVLGADNDLDTVLERLRQLDLNRIRLHDFERMMIEDAQAHL